MFVVSRDTCPNQARIVLMSTPARKRCTAVVCRIVWGLTRLTANEGTCADALCAERSTSVWSPKRVRGRCERLRKTDAVGSRSPMRATSVCTVRGHRGQERLLFPLPHSLTDGVWVSARSATDTLVASLARAPVL